MNTEGSCALCLLVCIFISQPEPSTASSVARFEIASVSSQSVVLRMIGAANVSRFEMDVKIFDLDRLKEFRRSELSAIRHEDQVGMFAFCLAFICGTEGDCRRAVIAD